MIEHELQRLTAAIEALTRVLQDARTHTQIDSQSTTPIVTKDRNNTSPSSDLSKDSQSTTPIVSKTRGTPEKPTESVNALSASATREEIQSLAVSITRADSAKKKDILAEFSKHGAQTISKLPDNALSAVKQALEKMAHQVADESEEDGENE